MKTSNTIDYSGKIRIKAPLRKYITTSMGKGEKEVETNTVSNALRKHLGSALGRGWTFTRQPDGWVVCQNPGGNPTTKVVKIREMDFKRGERYPM